MRSHVALAAILLAARAAAAEEPARLDEFTVTTPTRTAISADEALSSITIITRDDIELSQADRLGEALRFVGGLDVVRTGGPGQQTSLFLRGSESNHTLVLVDGVRMNPATIGVAAVQNIPVSLIQRVEIVTGPRSSLYGSDAIGGVINVITRDAGAGGEVVARVGGNNAERLAFSAGTSAGDWSVRAGVDGQRTGGIPARASTAEDRGYDNLSAHATATRALARGDVTLRHWQAQGTTEYADFLGAPVAQDYDNAVSAVDWRQQWRTGVDTRLIVSHLVDDITQRESPDFVRSSRTSVDLQGTVRTDGSHTVVAGVYAFRETAQSLSFGLPFDEDTQLTAVFVQDQFRTGRVDALAALRLTDHDAFGSQLTWNGAFGVDVTPTLRLQASGGRAFRAPDATDRFGFGGSPDLDPEISRQWSATGIWQPGGDWRLSLEYFSNDIRDLIDFDFATFTLRNIARAEIRGAELRGAWRADDWRVGWSLLVQSVEDRDTGERLLRRPERSATLDVARRFGALDVSVDVRADGARRDFGGTRLAGYVLVNAGLRYRLTPRWQLSAGVENLLDARYEPAADFRAQDRITSLGIRYTW